MIRQIYGDDYWKKFAELNPRAFDSYVQQFDRTVNGQDKVISTAQYSGYLQFKAKGAPIAFVNAPEGLPATPGVYGILENPPHPQAARLFMDWILGVPGQKALADATALYSPRADVPPPAGRHSDHRLQGARADRLGHVPEDPHPVRARVGQDDRHALTAGR